MPRLTQQNTQAHQIGHSHRRSTNIHKYSGLGTIIEPTLADEISDVDSHDIGVKVFHHSSLRNDHIRLLGLSVEKCTGSIQLTLNQYPLSTAPSFCTLSYCWGEGTKNQPCFCTSESSEGLLFLTPSLCEILRNIANHDFSNGLPMWVDQICINQADNEERSSQVKLMSQIYSTAVKTLIHLGDEIAGDQEAAQLLQHLIENPVSFRNARSIIQHLQYLRWKGYSIIWFFQRTAWSALFNVINKPWFNRVWVVQEFALSKECHVIYCGKTYPWSEFVKGILQGGYHGSFWQWYHRESASDMAMCYRVLNDLVGLLDQPETSAIKTVEGVLNHFGGRKASDPHDKLYGLLGLTQNAEDLIEKIDYDEPLFVTYTRAARHAIEERCQRREVNYLGILGCIDPFQSHRRYHTPSWVPDLCCGSESLEEALLRDEEVHEETIEHKIDWETEARDLCNGLDRLPVRGVFIGKLSAQVECRFPQEAVLHNTDRQLLSCRGGQWESKFRTSWTTEEGVWVFVHNVCVAGDILYVLHGLNYPCVLHKVGDRDFVFKGIAWANNISHIDIGNAKYRDLNHSYHEVLRTHSQAERIMSTRYKPAAMSDQQWRELLYDPWERQEQNCYPFITEDLFLV